MALFWKRKKKGQIPRWFIITMTIIFVFGLFCLAFVFIFSEVYKDRIFPGVYIGQINLGGKNYQEAHDILQEKVNKIIDEGVSFSFKDEKFNIPSTIEDEANLELSFQMISLPIDETLEHLKETYKNQDELERVLNWITKVEFPFTVQIDNKLIESLSAELRQYENPGENAKLIIKDENNFEILPEKYGQAFDYNEIMDALANQLKDLNNNTIEVNLATDQPKIIKTKAEEQISTVKQILSAAPFLLVYQDRKWELTKDQIINWMEFQSKGSQITVGLNQDELKKYLEDISKEVNVEVQEGKFEMKDGKVAEFSPSRTGLNINIDKSITEINDKINKIGVKEIDLIIDETKPKTNMGDVNDLGIKELIGEGRSNFKGSPKNRRHNIGVGAGTLNGILIKTNEEFSLVKAIGKVEASTGYLPELVIKGSKTIPEYGGGLCQIGTTTFRVALDAGLPILERTSHSYRVSYYEPPAGMDATIYDPKPDLKFINDTGHYILFQTEILGDELIFRFYGTKDGRKVEKSEPRLYNYVKPGPTKLIETLDLKPGEKKCTEKAHTGADAEFTYKVTYPSGEVKTQVFKSHYKSWSEVCLIGVEKLSEENKTE